MGVFNVQRCKKDITTRTLEGIPTKFLHTIVVSVPGYGIMSGVAYKKLMENNDVYGIDI